MFIGKVKYLLIVLFILAISFVAFVVYQNRTFFSQTLNLQETAAAINGTTIQIEVDFDDYKIKPNSIDYQALKENLDKLGLSSFENVPFIAGVRLQADNDEIRIQPTITARNIIVRVLPLSKETTEYQNTDNFAQKKLLTLTSDSGPYTTYYSGIFNLETQTLEIPVFVDLDFIVQEGGEPNIYLTETVLQSIFYNFQKPPLENLGNPGEVFLDHVGIIKKPLLQVEKKVSLLNFQLIKTAFAVGQCQSDGYECGDLVQTKRCVGGTNNGGTCPLGNSQCPGGGCETTSSCSFANASGGSCDLTSSGTGCNTGGCGSCSRGQCSYQAGGSCTPNGLKPSENGGAACCSGCLSSGTLICNSCPVASTAPDPSPTQPPPPGTCSSGSCYAGLNNCGQVGKQQVGTCSGGLCCALPDSGGGGSSCGGRNIICDETDDCCSGYTCTRTPDDTDTFHRCRDCEDLADDLCPTDPKQLCGQSIPGVSGCGDEKCAATQTTVVPVAPTNLKPDTGTETDGSDLCNLSCADDFDCAAHQVELKRDGGIVHFDGWNENATVIHDNDGRVAYKESWSLDSDSAARGGSGRWTQAAGARVTFPTTYKNIVVYTGYDDDGGNLGVYANGVLKKTVDLDCDGPDCVNHEWGKSFALNVSSTERDYVCHNSQCRLKTAKGSSNCQNDETKAIRLSWTKVTGYNTYEIQIYPNDNRTCDDPDAVCQTVTGRTFTFLPPTGTAKWAWRVRAVNDLCSGLYKGGAWSGRQIFTLTSTITGRFYLDPNDQAAKVGGLCTLAGASAFQPPAGSTIGADTETGSEDGTITGSTYSISVPTWSGASANNIVTFTPNNDPDSSVTYTCSCPNGCTYSGRESPESGVNFYLLPTYVANSGWWQVTNGNIYSGGTATPSIQSTIPTATCTTAAGCEPYLALRDDADTSKSAGVIVTGGGDIDTQDTDGNQNTSATQRSGTPTIAKGSSVSYVTEDYDYFYNRFEMGDNPTDDFAASADDAGLPTAIPADGKAAYYHNGNLKIQRRWNLGTNDPVTSIVVFVNGNLILDDVSDLKRLVIADPGTFLAFIVKGNIIIESSVGNSVLTDDAVNVEGIYIADGNITIRKAGAANGGDQRFIGEGSFISWSGVKLQRNFASDSDATRVENNNTIPVESFFFRPDYIKNIPEQMTTTRYVWQETN